MRTRFLTVFPFAFDQIRRSTQNTGMTLAQWIEFYYRVRKTEYDMTVDGDNASGEMIMLSLGGVNPPSSEQQIQRFSQTTASGVSGPLSFGFDFVETNLWRDPVGGLYYPDLEMTFNVPGGFVTSANEAPYTVPSAVTCTLNGISVPLFDAGGGPSGSVVLEYSEWWPFDRSDATNPITDSATGAMLLDPHQTDELP